MYFKRNFTIFFFSFIIQQPSNNLKGFLLETMCTVQLFLSSLTSEVKLSRNDLKEIINSAFSIITSETFLVSIILAPIHHGKKDG